MNSGVECGRTVVGELAVSRRDGRTPAEVERAVKSHEAERFLPAAERQRLMKRLMEMRWELVRAVCSDAWYDHCWASGDAFPPPAETTPMRPCRCERCRATGRVWPGYYDASDLEAGRPSGGPRHEPDGPRLGERRGNEPIGDARQRTARDSDNASAPAMGDGAILSYECYLESLDDWSAAQLPSSPSGMALRAIREGRIRLRSARTKTRRRG